MMCACVVAHMHYNCGRSPTLWQDLVWSTRMYREKRILSRQEKKGWRVRGAKLPGAVAHVCACTWPLISHYIYDVSCCVCLRIRAGYAPCAWLFSECLPFPQRSPVEACQVKWCLCGSQCGDGACYGGAAALKAPEGSVGVCACCVCSIHASWQYVWASASTGQHRTHHAQRSTHHKWFPEPHGSCCGWTRHPPAPGWGQPSPAAKEGPRLDSRQTYYHHSVETRDMKKCTKRQNTALSWFCS